MKKGLMWKLLRQHISKMQLVGFSVANLVGLTIVILAVQFYSDVLPVFNDQESFISKDYLIISRNLTSAGALMGGTSEFSDNDIADKWYRAKLAFITIDEKTQKEKRSSVNYLINAGSLNGAVKNIDEVMSQSMVDYLIVSVNETTIMDVFEYKKKEKNDKPEYEQQ